MNTSELTVQCRRMYMKGHGVEHISSIKSLPESQVREMLGLETIIIEHKIDNPKQQNEMPVKTKSKKGVPLSEKKKNQIKRLKSKGLVHREIAEICGVAVGTVSRVTSQPKPTPRRSSQYGTPKARLTREQKAEIKKLWNQGIAVEEIANTVGCGASTVSRIMKGKKRKTSTKQVSAQPKSSTPKPKTEFTLLWGAVTFTRF